jgi:hypothetical protein
MYFIIHQNICISTLSFRKLLKNYENILISEKILISEYEVSQPPETEPYFDMDLYMIENRI